MTDARESVWRRREAKRRAAVEAVKASRGYAVCSERPPTPDPSDRALTKRQWERGMQDWRQALRTRVAQRPIDWLGGPEDLEIPVVPFLHGCWEDPHAWAYCCDLPPGFANDEHINAPLPWESPSFALQLGDFDAAATGESALFRYEVASHDFLMRPWDNEPEVGGAFTWRCLMPHHL
jgi:hypothetical protein